MKKNKHLFINGPFNILRLEGTVGSVKKVIYLFMDVHMPESSQYKCENPRAVDIQSFLVFEFERLQKSDPDKMFDFMFERGLLKPHHFANEKVLYLGEISDLFSKAFKIDLQANRAQSSDLIPNVRFHFIDVRDYIMRKSHNVIFHKLQTLTDTIYADKNYNLKQLKELFDYVQVVQSEFSVVYSLLYKTEKLSNPKISRSLYSAHMYKMYDISETDNYKLNQKLIYKLLVKYENPAVKEKITEIINNRVHDMFIELFDYVDKTLFFINEEIDIIKSYGQHDVSQILLQQSNNTYAYGQDKKNSLKKIFEIRLIGDNMFKKAFDIGVYLMDLYKLRRMIDKPYIQNIINYAGGYHSQNYVQLLVNHFGFKLTNYSYLKNNDIKAAEKVIKKTTNPDQLNILFFPTLLGQCSDLGSFPKLFY